MNTLLNTDKDILTLSETPWAVIAVSMVIPVVLTGWAMGATWVHVNISSPLLGVIAFVLLVVVEISLLLRDVWPTKIIVDLKKHQLVMIANCPFVYKPKVIDISDIAKIRLNHGSIGVGRQAYNLLIEKHDGTKITFGDLSNNQKKYEDLRDGIASFAGIDNITRRSSRLPDA